MKPAALSLYRIIEKKFGQTLRGGSAHTDTYKGEKDFHIEKQVVHNPYFD